MDNKIEFRLVSPEKKLFEEPVALAVMPGEAGQFGVGAGHTSLVASLKVGVVELYAEGQKDKPQTIFISGGFADVTGDKCVVLAEEAVKVSDLDSAELKSQLLQQESDLKLAAELADQMLIQGQIDLTRAKLDAIAA